MDSQMTQSQMLLKMFKLLVNSGVCPENTIKDWVRSMLYLHGKGWLYVGFEEEEPRVAVAMYRVKEVTEDINSRYPEKEEGTILYVPFFASVAKDRMLARKLLTSYLDKNKDITEIVFYDLKDNEKLHRYKRVVKEVSNEQEQITRPAGDTEVSGESPVHAGVGATTDTRTTAD